MINNQIKTRTFSNYEDELDYAIAEAIDYFAHCNIRFRTPNRNIKPTNQQKYFKTDRETD